MSHFAIVSLALLSASAFAADPLPSWNGGDAKTRILKFVERVTDEKAPGFVPAAERIAVFDNDGTLWSEQPMYFQFAFAIDQVRGQWAQHPEWKENDALRAVHDGKLKEALKADPEGTAGEIVTATHAGMTTEAFDASVRKWVESARDPRFGKPYPALTYRPMKELLAYLKSKGFKNYIVSGGGIDFMRPWTEKVYGVPPENVVGSSGKTKVRKSGNRIELIKEPDVEFINDGPGKVSGIHRFIGRRPIFAFGNSDGDLEMLQWTDAHPKAHFAALVHHTDAEREWSYDRASKVGKLDKAWDEATRKKWLVVDMKKDWRAVFSADAAAPVYGSVD